MRVLRRPGCGTLTAWADNEALLAAIERGPQEFRAELRRTAQLAIAESIAAIPPPRTIGELAKWVDILYKTDRLDAKVPGSDTRGVRWARSLTRSVVEVEVVPTNRRLAIGRRVGSPAGPA